MPIFNKYVSPRIAQKQVGAANQRIANSVMGKAGGMDKVDTADEYAKYVKSQKKGPLYVQ